MSQPMMARASTTAAASRHSTRLAGGEKGLTFASRWYFKESGVVEVKRRFAAEKTSPVSFLIVSPENLLNITQLAIPLYIFQAWRGL